MWHAVQNKTILIRFDIYTGENLIVVALVTTPCCPHLQDYMAS
jgi:hypothetical protein